MSARTQKRHWKSRKIDDNLLRQVAPSPKPSTSDEAASYVGCGTTLDQVIGVDYGCSTDQVTPVDEDSGILYNSSDIKINVDYNELSDQHGLCNKDLSGNKCEFCDQLFNCYIDLTKHLKEDHFDEPVMDSDSKKLSTSTASDKLVKHYKHKTGTFKCEFCEPERVYRYNYDLVRHVKNIHVKKLKNCEDNKTENQKIKAYIKKLLPFKCQICGYIYVSQSGLSHHLKSVHSSEAAAKAKYAKEIGDRSKKLLSLISNMKSKTTSRSTKNASKQSNMKSKMVSESTEKALDPSNIKSKTVSESTEKASETRNMKSKTASDSLEDGSEISSSSKSPALKGNKVMSPKRLPKEKASMKKKTVQPKIPSHGTLLHPKVGLSSPPSPNKSPPKKGNAKFSDKRMHPIKEIHDKNEKKLKCKLCKKVYTTRPGIMYHLKVTHLYCVACYKQFCYQKIYDRHMEIKHNQRHVVVDDNYFSDLSKVSATAGVSTPDSSKVKPDPVDAKPQIQEANDCDEKMSVSSQNSSIKLAVSSTLSKSLSSDVNPVKIPEGMVLSPVKIKLNRLPSDHAALTQKFAVVSNEDPEKHDLEPFTKNDLDMDKSNIMSSVDSTGPKDMKTTDSACKKPRTRSKLGPKSKQKSSRISYRLTSNKSTLPQVIVSYEGNIVKLSKVHKCDDEQSVTKEETLDNDVKKIRKTQSRSLTREREETHSKDTTPEVVHDGQFQFMDVDSGDVPSTECSALSSSQEDITDHDQPVRNSDVTRQSPQKHPTSTVRITRSSSQPDAKETSCSHGIITKSPSKGEKKDSTELPTGPLMSAACGTFSVESTDVDPAMQLLKSSSRRLARKDRSTSEPSNSKRSSRKSTKSSEHLIGSSQSVHSTSSPSPQRTRKKTVSSELIQLTHSTMRESATTKKSLSSAEPLSENSTNSSESLTCSAQFSLEDNTPDIPSNISSNSTDNYQPLADPILTSSELTSEEKSGSEAEDTCHRIEPTPLTEKPSSSRETIEWHEAPVEDTTLWIEKPSSSRETMGSQEAPLKHTTLRSEKPSSSRETTESQEAPLKHTTLRSEKPSSSRETTGSQEAPLKHTTLRSEKPSFSRETTGSQEAPLKHTTLRSEKPSFSRETTGRQEAPIKHTTLHSRCNVDYVRHDHDIRELMFGKSCSACDLHVDDQQSPEHHDDLKWKIVQEEKSYDLNKLTLKITRDMETSERSVKTHEKFFCNLTGLKLKIVRDFSQRKRTVLSDDDRKCQEGSNSNVSDTTQAEQVISSMDGPQSDVEKATSGVQHDILSPRGEVSSSVTSDNDDLTSPIKNNMKDGNNVTCPENMPRRTRSDKSSDRKATQLTCFDDAACIYREETDSGGARFQKRSVGGGDDTKPVKQTGDVSVQSDLGTNLVRFSGDDIKNSTPCKPIVGPAGDSAKTSTSDNSVSKRIIEGDADEVDLVAVQVITFSADPQEKTNINETHCSDENSKDISVHQDARLSVLQKSPGKKLGIENEHKDTDNNLTLCSKSFGNLLQHVEERGVAKVLVEKLGDPPKETLPSISRKKRACVSKLNKPAPACIKKRRLVNKELCEKAAAGLRIEAMEESEEQFESENVLKSDEEMSEETDAIVPCELLSGATIDEIDGECITSRSGKVGCDNTTDTLGGQTDGNYGVNVFTGEDIGKHLLEDFNESDLDLLLKDESCSDIFSDSNVEVTLSGDGLYATVNTPLTDANNNHFKGKVLKEIMEIIQFASPGIFQPDSELAQCGTNEESIGLEMKSKNLKKMDNCEIMKSPKRRMVVEKVSEYQPVKNICAFGQLDSVEKTPELNNDKTIMELSPTDEHTQQDSKKTDTVLRNINVTKSSVDHCGEKLRDNITISEKSGIHTESDALNKSPGEGKRPGRRSLADKSRLVGKKNKSEKAGDNIWPPICSVCGNSFCSRSTLERHQAKYHPEEFVKQRKCSVVCKLCGMTYANKQNLKKHIAKRHSENFANSDEAFKLICEEIETDSSPSSDHHSKVKPKETYDMNIQYRCLLCDITFKNLSSITCHIESSHKSRDKLVSNCYRVESLGGGESQVQEVTYCPTGSSREHSILQSSNTDPKMDESAAAVHNLLESFGSDASFDTHVSPIQESDVINFSENHLGGQAEEGHGDQQENKHPEEMLQEPVEGQSPRQHQPHQGEDGPPRQGEDGPPRQGEDGPPHQGEDEQPHQGEDGQTHHTEGEPPHQGEVEQPRQEEDGPPCQGEDETRHQGEDGPPRQGKDEQSRHGDDEPPQEGEDELPCQGEVGPPRQGEAQQPHPEGKSDCNREKEPECHREENEKQQGNQNQNADGKDLVTKPSFEMDQNLDVVKSLSETTSSETPVHCPPDQDVIGCSGSTTEEIHQVQNCPEIQQVTPHYVCKSDDKICMEVADQTGFFIHRNCTVKLVRLHQPSTKMTMGDDVLKPEGSGKSAIWKISTVSRNTAPNNLNLHEDEDERHVEDHKGDEDESRTLIQTVKETENPAKSVFIEDMPSKRFVCESCGLAYVTKKSLKRHIFLKHSETVTKLGQTKARCEDEIDSNIGTGYLKFTQIQTTAETSNGKTGENTGLPFVVHEPQSESEEAILSSTDGMSENTSAQGELVLKANYTHSDRRTIIPVDKSESHPDIPRDKSNNNSDVLKNNFADHQEVRKDELKTQAVLDSTLTKQPVLEELVEWGPGQRKKNKILKSKKEKEKTKSKSVKVTSSSTPLGSAITAFEMAISTPSYSQQKSKKRKLDRQTSSEGPPSKQTSSAKSKAKLDEKPPGDQEEKLSSDIDARIPSHTMEIFHSHMDEMHTGSVSDGVEMLWQQDVEFQNGSETTSPRKAESPRKSNKKSIDKIVQGIIQRQKDIENKKNKEKLDPPEVHFPMPFEEILAQSKNKMTKVAEVTNATEPYNDENSNSSGSVKSGKLSTKPVDIFTSLQIGPTVKFGKSFRKASSKVAALSADEEPQHSFRSPLDRVRVEMPMKFRASQECKKTGEASSKSNQQSNKNYLIDILKDIPSIYGYSIDEGPYVSPWDNPSVTKVKKSVIDGNKPPVVSKVHFESEVNVDAAADTSNDDNIMETSNDVAVEISNEGGEMEISELEGKMETKDNCQVEDLLQKSSELVPEEADGEKEDFISATPDDHVKEKHICSDEEEEDHKLMIADDEDHEHVCKDSSDEDREHACKDSSDEEDSDKDLRNKDVSDNDVPSDDGQSIKEEEEEDAKESDGEKEEEEYDFLSPATPQSKPHEKKSSDEERDILSIDYDSDEASFLGDEDDVRSVISKKSVSKRRSLVAVESELEAVENSSVAMSAMDLASESSIVNSTIQCNVPSALTPAVVSRAASLFFTWGGYCNNFLVHGNCRRTNTCRFQHSIPPLEWFYQQGQATILNSRQTSNKERAFEVYQLLKTLNVRPITRDVVEVLLQLSVNDWDTDAAFQLFGDLKSTDLINNKTSSMLVRLCNNSPQNYTDQLWALFQVVLEKNLKLNGACLDTVVQAFSMRREYTKLWEVLFYCNSVPYYVVPIQVLQVLLFTCLKSPGEYLPAITKWVETCNLNILHQLEHTILLELYNISVKYNSGALSSLLEQLNATQLPENQVEIPETSDILGEQDWNGDNVTEGPITSSDEYKGRQHRIRGCKLTKNWEHLGSIFVELCCDLELSNPHYVQEYIYVITDTLKPESTANNFKIFLQAIHKELETKMADNMDVLDEPSLARIGAGLLGWCFQERLWEEGYRLLFVMHQTGVYYHKCTGCRAIGTALIAMEICLNTNKPESALQILQRSKGQIMTTENGANVTRILDILFDKLLEKSFTKMAFSVLVIIIEKREQDQAKTDLSGHFNFLVRKSLATGDVHTAFLVYKVQKETDSGQLEMLGLRGLLTACGKHRFDNKYIKEVYESCVMRKLYPPQILDTPRAIVLSCMMTPVEMYLYISDYLNVLYNTLCECVMDGTLLTIENFCLTVRVWWEENPLQQMDFPYLSLAPQTRQEVWHMALYVLNKHINPPIQADYNQNSDIIYINPESLLSYLQEKDRNGRKQGLHIQTGAGGPAKMRGRAWARPQNFSSRGRGRPYR